MNDKKEGHTARFFRRLLPASAKHSFRMKRMPDMMEADPGRVKKVLVVDDDAIMLKTTSMKLQAEGYTVVTAADGAEAIKRVREESPDLILLDIMFPPDVAHGGGVPWDGFLLLRWLRNLEQSRKVPVVLISGDAARYKDRALAAGAMGIFGKPLEFDRLLPRMQLILEARVKETRPEDNFQI